MSREVPEGWTAKSIGEVATIIMGQSPPSSVVNSDGIGLPFIQGNAEFGARYPEPRQFAADCPKVVEAGDILLSVRAPVGEVNVAPERLCIGRGLAGLRPIHSDHDFLYFAVGGLAPVFARLSQGSTFDAINGKDLRSIPLLMPPLDEQRRIAEVLRSVDEAIAANEAVAVQARAAYQAALEELVGRSGDHWKTTSLGELATFVNGRGFKPHEWNDEGLPIIRIQNLNGGADFNYYNGEFNPKILVQPGDLLFAWSGSRGTSFGPHIWRGPQGVLNYHTWKVVPKEPEDRDYLYFALRHLTKKIEDEAHGASALVHMQKAYVVDYEIDLPSPEERRTIATVLTDLLEAANHANRVHGEAMVMKGHLLGDLLSGRVRVPAVANNSTRSVPPAFRRAVFAAEIVHQLHHDNRFGSVKHEKIVHLCELHLGLQDDLDRHAYKEAAGPYDPKARRSVERIFQQQKWFDTTKPDGNRVVYVPLDKAGGHSEYFDRYFGEQKLAIQSIIDILRPLNTEQCEIVATLYAVWNDFLIDGKQPTEQEIVATVLQWHPKKHEIAEDRWLAALPWMRRKGLVPKGTGEKTRVAQA